MGIGDETFVSLTTFTRDGRPKHTPVWIAPLGEGQVGVTTRADSWKVRRIRADPRVVLQACDVRGRVTAGSEPVDGTAEVVSGEDHEAVRRRVADKYGWQYSLIELRDRVKGVFGRPTTESAGIVITPGD